MSPTGQCKPFDSLADGYCRSEGCGLFVLKRLSDAEAEGDHIYGIIRGIEMNQCGTAKSITHPDHETQAELFSRLLINSRCHADSISVIEAHGTGKHYYEIYKAAGVDHHKEHKQVTLQRCKAYNPYLGDRGPLINH